MITENIINVDLTADLGASSLPLPIKFAIAEPNPRQVLAQINYGMPQELENWHVMRTRLVQCIIVALQRIRDNNDDHIPEGTRLIWNILDSISGEKYISVCHTE